MCQTVKRREETEMNVMDFELLRERRAELLREAGSKRAFRRQRSGNHQKRARG